MTNDFTRDERRAIGLYAIAARDFTDFIDMVVEPETSNEALQFLKEMCESTDHPNTDFELNKLMLPFVLRAIESRIPAKTAHQRIMDPDD